MQLIKKGVAIGVVVFCLKGLKFTLFAYISSFVTLVEIRLEEAMKVKILKQIHLILSCLSEYMWS